MNHPNDSYVPERTAALATMYLTRRNDLRLRHDVKVKRGRQTQVLDLLVEIVNDDKPGLRNFGIELEGRTEAVTPEQANVALRTKFQSLRSLRELPYPVLLLLFTMEDDAGYFAWVTEPVLHGESAKLLLHTEPAFTLLDRRALDATVDQLNHWYDAFYTALIA